MKNYVRNMHGYIKRNKRILLFLYLPAYLLWFWLLEQSITDNYYVSYMPLDDKIPFVPEFILAYVLWFPFLLLPAVYLYFRDARAFTRFGFFFMLSFSISLIICAAFPNGQDLRPDDTGTGLFAWMVNRIYMVDTNTNVLPSMHVVGCAAVTIAAFDSSTMRRVRIPILILALAICASTVLVKQHSILDTLWSIPVVLFSWAAVYLIPKLVKKGTKGKGRAS